MDERASETLRCMRSGATKNLSNGSMVIGGINLSRQLAIDSVCCDIATTLLVAYIRFSTEMSAVRSLIATSRSSVARRVVIRRTFVASTAQRSESLFVVRAHKYQTSLDLTHQFCSTETLTTTIPLCVKLSRLSLSRAQVAP